MNKIFTLKSILKLAYLFNHNKLEFDTKFTDNLWSVVYQEDEWTVVRPGRHVNRACLCNEDIGEFIFTRICDTGECRLADFDCKTKDAHAFSKMHRFIHQVIDEPTLLDKFKK